MLYHIKGCNISLEDDRVLAKFTIIISWFPISIPLILINEIGKYLSCNNI